MKIGEKVIIKRDDFREAGKINEIIDNPNQPLLYGVISNGRTYYCKEEELEISK